VLIAWFNDESWTSVASIKIGVKYSMLEWSMLSQ